MPASTHHECGSCGDTSTGYTRQELQKDGWTWHASGFATWFIVCDACNLRYEERRRIRQALTTQPEAA